MNDLQIFNNAEFGQIRTVTIDNEPWFVGKDVCELFGDTNYRRSLANVDDCDKGVSQMNTAGGKQSMTIINESGLYALLFQMQPQKAKGVSQNDNLINERIEKLRRFKRWITHEVIPSIRKTGSYSMPQTTAGQIHLLAQGYVELEQKLDGINKDLQDFKQDMPLLAVECEKITKAVKVKGIEVLGGRNSEAYMDKSVRSKVYQDIHNEVKRQFGVNTYKAIKRSECDKAIEIIKSYELPMALANEVLDCNAQLGLRDVV